MTDRAITCQQPWAAMIVRGCKAVEHRSWRTSYRGRLWIHAGLEFDEDARRELESSAQIAHCSFGAILGHVELTGITGRPGAYEWLLADAHEIEPVPCRGWPGIWKWPR